MATRPGRLLDKTFTLLGKVLEKAARQLDQASEDLAAEIFDVDK